MCAAMMVIHHALGPLGMDRASLDGILWTTILPVLGFLSTLYAPVKQETSITPPVGKTCNSLTRKEKMLPFSIDWCRLLLTTGIVTCSNKRAASVFQRLMASLSADMAP
jgi:hypothetical protein